MSIKTEIEKLKEPDLWSLLLFVLFKIKDDPEYSSLSELAYILDRKNMLKLCEYFGGCTIRIPTIDELETLIYGLLLYQYVDIDGIMFDNAVSKVQRECQDIKQIKAAYHKIHEILNTYSFVSRARDDL